MILQPFNAISAFFSAIPILLRPGLRLFLIVPLLVNVALMVFLYIVAFSYFTDFVDYLMSWVPGWLFFLHWFFYLSFVLFAGIVLFYGFSVGVNIIAAPFNGLLSEKVEAVLTGQKFDEILTVKKVYNLVVDSLSREFKKIIYFLPRFILLFIVSLLPGINIISPVLWLLFSAWMLSIQYMDYAFDNNKVSFDDMRLRLRRQPLLCWTFGFIVMLLLPIPFVNLVVMPLAVVASTILWLKSFKEYYSPVSE